MKKFENQEAENEVKVLKKFLNPKRVQNMYLKKEIFMIL